MQYWLRVTRGAPSAGNAYVSSSQQATASVAPAAAARGRTEGRYGRRRRRSTALI
ncbi:unnamed protein product [Plutella xylostella]|uniref:(diamondback moth) hypothetical protein n=1 Tax=Plutella xylostella TaxID=51655 RepID=A0A8S4DHW0_PLUXY|nr:unnamed protein product [Plutella xylostella]